MFSENSKVSGRQLGRMIFVETAGTTAFLSLNIFGKYGSDGIIMMLWVYLFAMIYAMACFKAAKSVGNFQNKKIYRIIRAFIMIVLLAKYLCMSAIVLNAIADVARLILIPDVSSFFIIVLTIVCVLYCINGGIESRGRACEILFYSVLIPILIICVMLIPKVEPGNILPEFSMNLKSAIWDYFIIIWFFVPGELLLLSKDCYDNTPKVRGNVYASITLSAVVNIGIFASALGVYGDATVAKMDRPVLRLLQISGIPGDFLNRQEGIMSVFLIVSMFCSAWALIYHINGLIRNLFMQNNNVKSALKVSSVAVILIVAIFFMYEGKYKEKIISVNIGGMDLEERKFVMSIIVEKSDEGLKIHYETASGNGAGTGGTGESGNVSSSFQTVTAATLEEAEEKIEFGSGAYIDYSHMKVFIMDIEVMEDIELVKNIVTEISDDIEFAENIVVCGIDLNGELNVDKEYGKVIEEITKNQESFKESEVFRFDKMYSLKEGAITIPLIDKDVKLVGSGIVTNDAVFWQYVGE